MGTAASFDIATITDLELLNMVYKEEYHKNMLQDRSLAVKVGDDLACYDPKRYIYNTYTKILGMEINMSKTKTCTDENLCCEFVSRNLNYGKDVSRVSANICRSVRKNFLDLPQLSSHLSEREYGYTFPFKSLMQISGVKERDYLIYIRTFIILHLLHPRSGLEIMYRSIHDDFPDLVYGDRILSLCKDPEGLLVFKDSFNL